MTPALTGRTALLDRLRDEIRRIERRPDRRTGVVPCGLPAVDAALPAGGFPRGALSELRGGPSSGKTAVALALVASLPSDELAAFVDGTGELYPPAAAALGVDLGRLLIVRSAPGDVQARAEVGRTTSELGSRPPPYGEPRSEASARERPRAHVEPFWAAEALLASGAFAAVIVDVPAPLRGAEGLLRRLQTAAEKGGAVGLWLATPGATARVPAGARLDLSLRDGRIVARRNGQAPAGAGAGGHAA
jgi:protein ImuA